VVSTIQPSDIAVILALISEEASTLSSSSRSSYHYTCSLSLTYEEIKRGLDGGDDNLRELWEGGP
jgi:hypothetical protein